MGPSVLARVPFFTALLLAGLTAAITIRYATFVPWGTDAAGYVAAARRWADRDLYKPAPLQLWAPWSFVGPLAVDAPLANRRGRERGTNVGGYPLGFPVFAAAADKLDRELGVYAVAPLFAALLVWCAFLLGRRLAGPWSGVLAAVLVATSPVTLAYAVTPMSDVPAAAFLFLALEMSLRQSLTGAAAAGSAMAAAVMVRPVLAPLALVPGILALTLSASKVRAWREWQWRRALVFAAFAVVGPLMVGWSQYELYGGFFTSGYVGSEAFFKAEHIWSNLEIYPRNVMVAHTPVIFLGLILGFVLFASDTHPERRRLGAALFALVFLNYALYVSFLPYDDIAYLRFVLPALTALFVLLAAVCVWLVRVALQTLRLLAPLALVPAAIVIAGGDWPYPPISTQAAAHRQVMLMGRYLREALPRNAAIITFLHSGAVAHYTGAEVVRFDLIERQQLEPIVEQLERRGYRPVFVIDLESEAITFNNRFLKTRYERLNWRQRAVFFGGGTAIWYVDAADRHRDSNRSRYPTDVLN